MLPVPSQQSIRRNQSDTTLCCLRVKDMLFLSLFENKIVCWCISVLLQETASFLLFTTCRCDDFSFRVGPFSSTVVPRYLRGFSTRIGPWPERLPKTERERIDIRTIRVSA
jgi:hypothetical protein